MAFEGNCNVNGFTRPAYAIVSSGRVEKVRSPDMGADFGKFYVFADIEFRESNDMNLPPFHVINQRKIAVTTVLPDLTQVDALVLLQPELVGMTVV